MATNNKGREMGKPAIEQLIQDLNNKDESIRARAGVEILKIAPTNIDPFGMIFERKDVDIEVKRRLMRLLETIPGALRALSIYNVPPLGTKASNDDTED